MSNTRTKILFIVDRSGSMSSLRDSVIEGFNGFVASQKELTDSCEVTFCQFDHEFETVFADRPIKDVPELTTHTYIPRGNTALYDAIVRGINEFTPRCCPMDQILVIIQTDGMNNASREARINNVKELISKKQEEGWLFTFLGANLDAILEAGNMGISQDHAMQFNSNINSNKAVYGLMTNKVGALRSSKGTGVSGQSVLSYTGDERRSVDV